MTSCREPLNQSVIPVFHQVVMHIMIMTVAHIVIVEMAMMHRRMIRVILIRDENITELAMGVASISDDARMVHIVINPNDKSVHNDDDKV